MEFNKRKIFTDAGERLVQFRKKFAYNRTQMATHLGLRRNAYYKNETGLSLPGLGTLYRLAMEHHLSMDWFFFGKGPMYYDEKEKDKEIVELKTQLEQMQKKILELEQENKLACEGEDQKEKKAVQVEIKPEIKELIENMEEVPLLYYEILTHYQRFKLENKALIEKI